MNFDAALQAQIARTRRHGLGELLWRSAQRVPAKTALVYRDQRWNYAELDALVNRMANALRERGVAKGERVAVLSHNNASFVVLQFALARAGAIMVPINFMLKASEVAFILEHSGAIALVAEDMLVPVADEALAHGPHSVRLRGVIPDHGAGYSDGWEDTTRWLAHPDTRAPDVPVDDDEAAQILYTSGTESRPKGATLSVRNLVAQYVSCIVDGDMSGDDVEVHALPLFHCAQLHCFMN